MNHRASTSMERGTCSSSATGPVWSARSIRTALTTVAGKVGWEGFNREKGPATKVWLNEPVGLFFDDHAGVLYIGDTFNARIRAVYWRAHEWQRRCEAKGERCARAAKQSLALPDRCAWKAYSRKLVPSEHRTVP